VSIGKLPSPWALALIGLIPLRWVLHRLLDRVGHGELLILFGITAALMGANIFELVEVKGDVGALVFGMLLANHARTNELAKALLGFKELFLVGFFLSVGMTDTPGWAELLVAGVLMLLLPLKVAMYFGLFNLFCLRASTSWRAALNLSNYSEFGLIVGALAVSMGWLSGAWLTVFAIVISVSFILCAPLNSIRDNLYRAWRPRLKYFEREKRLPGEENIDLQHVHAAVFGMGRIGSAAYHAMESDYAGHLIGVEIEPEKAERLSGEGREIVCGDVTNPDFWERAPGLISGLEWVLLTLPTHAANLSAAQRLKELGYTGGIVATSKYRDEEVALKALGVDYTFNIYAEAGLGFASELHQFVGR
jgi:hypothetical protein